jgi:transcription initiation factor TFIID subunit 5
MQYSSPTSSSTQGQLSNNVLLLPSNTSKMSFIIPSNTTNSSSSTNILSSASNSGMTTPPITLNGATSTQNSGQTLQQRLLLSSQRSQSQPIPQEEFQKILRALQDNNMSESAEIFKKEYQSLFNKTVSTFSEPYFTALDGYISYVQEQPDTSRHEFSQLIYPLFVHMYLDLVEKDHLEDAQRFFMNYVKNTNLQATVFAAHKDDLFRIKSLVSKEQIAQSEYVKSFRHNGRYWIKLCNASLELLDQFLIKQQKYPLLTKIVQAYFQLEINDGNARNAETQRLLSGGRLGEIKTEDNTNRMFYGLLRDHDLTRILQHKAIVSLSMGGDNEDGGGGGDDQPSTSKNRKKLKKDFFNQRQSKASLKVDPNSPQIARIPIPELREHERMDLINTFQGKNKTNSNEKHSFIVEDYSRMLKITPDNLPSCCYYTLLNGYLEINCLGKFN